MQKLVVWGVRGHPRSLETLPFDRAHMTSYLTLMETVSILYHFRVIARFSSKVANFNPSHLHLSPPSGVMITFEFRHDLWHQKTRVMGLSCVVICVILRLAILIQYRSVTDTYTHTQKHDDSIHRA